VVADEPTGALDTAASEGVIDALGDVVADGTALLVVTHDRAIAARASRIVTMADGRISGVETVAAPVA
jgi:ABC-type lipoprotein export system ATPase subunit